MKISEILNQAKQYHYAFGGTCRGMCAAAVSVFGYKEAMKREHIRSTLNFCKDLVDSIDEDNVYLWEALADQGLPNDTDTIAMIWDAVIDKLEHDGRRRSCV